MFLVLKRLPPLESLRFLEACVRHASFTRAAAELGVTPSAVSLRIRDLEAELGVALFVRTGPRVSVTDAGRTLANGISEALAIMGGAVDAAGRTKVLRVSAPPTFAARWLSPRLAEYHALPGAVAIRLDASSEIRPAGSFDLAIRTGHGDWPGLESVALMPVDAAPMLSPERMSSLPLNRPEQLAELTLLPDDDWPRWFAEGGIPSTSLRFAATNYPTHELDAQAALDGVGVALLSPTLFAPLVASGALVQPFSRRIIGPGWHYLLAHPNEQRSEVLKFWAWVQEQAVRQ